MSMTFVKPQLARAWTERRDFGLIGTAGYTMEPKLDGHRCAVIRTPKKVYLVSRRGKPIQKIPWLIEWAEEHLWPGTYIDGELVAATNGASSHDVHSLRARDPSALAYVAFDILYDKGESLIQRRWARRRAALCMAASAAEAWPAHGDLQRSKFYIISSHLFTDVKPLSVRKATLEMWLKQGFEGAVFKDSFAPYKPNSRSAWIKWKWSMYADVVVVSADALPSEWRVRPGHIGTDGQFYPDGQHTQPWLDGWIGLEYGYGPAGYLPLHMQSGLKNVPMIGLFYVAGSLGVTGPPDEMKQYIGKIAKTKCWGVYDTGALRHPQAEEFRDWDGRPVLPPEPTLEVLT